MSNTCIEDLLVYLLADSVTCELTVLSNYITITEIILQHYPRNPLVQHASHELSERINDKLNEMFQEGGNDRG